MDCQHSVTDATAEWERSLQSILLGIEGVRSQSAITDACPTRDIPQTIDRIALTRIAMLNQEKQAEQSRQELQSAEARMWERHTQEIGHAEEMAKRLHQEA